MFSMNGVGKNLPKRGGSVNAERTWGATELGVS